jgi:hypothetical protein
MRTFMIEDVISRNECLAIYHRMMCRSGFEGLQHAGRSPRAHAYFLHFPWLAAPHFIFHL